ncbi:hypothetical protein BgAZ_203530 [Babesia gibsoni]|uniref:t-SNARE coiled-coil homology domain-containing protein n=1 Tax=Babesia gibsoni TaxID=33632 RepID=A0AAD8PE79_BABGI|nr:hypothetical protein BgAZ_203530 [Babesia gibsoni]
MADAEGARRDPYDEAENKVRKNIRKVIVLQSQVLEELRSSGSNCTIESTSKGPELLKVCSGIESDIVELQKVIDAIKNKPEKYRISTKVVDARQSTINEFRSKIKGVRERNNAAQNKPSSSYGASLAQYQLKNQREILEQQDVQLNALNSSASNLHDNAMAINVELTNQNRMLMGVDESFDETQFRLHSLGKRMAIFLDTNNPSLLKLVIILSSIAMFLLLFIILF